MIALWNSTETGIFWGDAPGNGGGTQSCNASGGNTGTGSTGGNSGGSGGHERRQQRQRQRRQQRRPELERRIRQHRRQERPRRDAARAGSLQQPAGRAGVRPHEHGHHQRDALPDRRGRGRRTEPVAERLRRLQHQRPVVLADGRPRHRGPAGDVPQRGRLVRRAGQRRAVSRTARLPAPRSTTGSSGRCGSCSRPAPSRNNLQGATTRGVGADAPSAASCSRRSTPRAALAALTSATGADHVVLSRYAAALLRADGRFRRCRRDRPLRAAASPSSPISVTRTAFCTWSRFSASSKTTDCGPSITSAATSSPRWAGRQCMKTASRAAAAIISGVTWKPWKSASALCGSPPPAPSRSTRRCRRRRRRPRPPRGLP